MSIGKRWIFCLLVLPALAPLGAQEPVRLPACLDRAANVLQGRESLLPFLQKLRALEAGLRPRVSIVHIGDSHIQADWFTGYLRGGLQRRFGPAGRGLVFPYRAAGTHGPAEVTDRGRGAWMARRKTFEHREVALGISGMTLRTLSETAGIELGCGACPFDRLVAFHSGTARLNGPAAERHAFAFGTYWEFPKPVDTIGLELRPKGAELYGLVLHQSRRQGLLYHAIGVNGATFTHFNRAPLLLQQLPWLKPDLIILTLGTNEALQPAFQAEDLLAEARQLIAGLRRARPGVPILLTTPPDVLPAGSPSNSATGPARRALLKLAEAEQLACWDLYKIMGGKGSMQKWRELELAHTDFIHFTKPGYELQAQLLLEALYNAYGDAAH